jgi:hypothetical protein
MSSEYGRGIHMSGATIMKISPQNGKLHAGVDRRERNKL